MAQHEHQARKLIDKLLHAAGWLVQDADAAHISATRGVAIREFPLKRGHGFADYPLYVDGKAAGAYAPNHYVHTSYPLRQLARTKQKPLRGRSQPTPRNSDRMSVHNIEAKQANRGVAGMASPYGRRIAFIFRAKRDHPETS